MLEFFDGKHPNDGVFLISLFRDRIKGAAVLKLAIFQASYTGEKRTQVNESCKSFANLFQSDILNFQVEEMANLNHGLWQDEDEAGTQNPVQRVVEAVTRSSAQQILTSTPAPSPENTEGAMSRLLQCLQSMGFGSFREWMQSPSEDCPETMNEADIESFIGQDEWAKSLAIFAAVGVSSFIAHRVIVYIFKCSLAAVEDANIRQVSDWRTNAAQSLVLFLGRFYPPLRFSRREIAEEIRRDVELRFSTGHQDPAVESSTQEERSGEVPDGASAVMGSKPSSPEEMVGSVKGSGFAGSTPISKFFQNIPWDKIIRRKLEFLEEEDLGDKKGFSEDEGKDSGIKSGSEFGRPGEDDSYQSLDVFSPIRGTASSSGSHLELPPYPEEMTSPLDHEKGKRVSFPSPASLVKIIKTSIREELSGSISSNDQSRTPMPESTEASMTLTGSALVTSTDQSQESFQSGQSSTTFFTARSGTESEASRVSTAAQGAIPRRQTSAGRTPYPQNLSVSTFGSSDHPSEAEMAVLSSLLQDTPVVNRERVIQSFYRRRRLRMAFARPSAPPMSSSSGQGDESEEEPPGIFHIDLQK